MITSLRMYEVAPQAVRAWRALFAAVFAESCVDVEIVEHRWPAPIAALWAEPALCCAFMCGWPFVRARPPLQLVAAPVPSPPAYAGLPRYRSEFLVRESSGWTTLEQTFDHRLGWMSADSHSGFNAPRAHLLPYAQARGGALYAASRGPLGAPSSTLDALAAGEVDVVALDGFWLDLCRRHAPHRLAGVRSVAVTAWWPIPPLVAAPGVDAAIVARLARSLEAAHVSQALAPLLADCLVARFARPDPAAYAALDEAAEAASAAGYDVPA